MADVREYWAAFLAESTVWWPRPNSTVQGALEALWRHLGNPARVR